MAYSIVADRELAYAFCQERLGLSRTEHQRGIAQLRNGEIVAGIVYDDYNGQNVMMHVAAKPGVRWITRHLLREAFKYPFVTLDCARVTGWVEIDNWQARRLNEHLGFEKEARLIRAGSKGQDVIVYRMFREDCRYAH